MRFISLTDVEQVTHHTDLRAYRVYSLLIRSQWPLPCPEATDVSGLPDVELIEGSRGIFAKVHESLIRAPDRAEWLHQQQFSDGTIYLHWTGLFEFLISSNGDRIICRTLPGATPEAFQTYLLGHVISFALLKQGIEPLHSTAVVVDGHAVAFLGNCGYGKSSLAAAFLREGYRLLTDDLLVLKQEPSDFFAHPGLPRIKLFPEVAQATVGLGVAGVPMNPSTPKLILPLGPAFSWSSPVPLKALYVLRPHNGAVRTQKVTIRRLRQRQACLALIAGTFNSLHKQPDRLIRQLRFAAQVSSSVAINSLSYPRDLSRLPEVVQALRSNLSRRPMPVQSADPNTHLKDPCLWDDNTRRGELWSPCARS